MNAAVRRAPGGVSLRVAILFGLAGSVTLLGVWAIGYGVRAAPFPPFDLADLLIQRSPGGVATWAIEQFGHRAQRLLQLACLLSFTVAGAFPALALRRVATRRRGIALAVLTLPVLLALSWWAAGGLSLARGAWHAFYFGITLSGLGAALGGWLSQAAIPIAPVGSTHWLDAPDSFARRAVVRRAAGIALLVGLGGGLSGRLLRGAALATTPTAAGQPLDAVRAEVSATVTALPTPVPAPELPGAFSAPAGVRPRVTTNAQFYVVDISTRDPNLDERAWTLRVHGLVERELTLTYADLLAMPAVEQDGTLRCISFTYGNDLISSTRWTGVPLRDLLQRAGPLDGAVDLVCRGTNDYSDSIPLAKALEPTTLLAYGMNGAALPRTHGFPCRVYVPNLYGEKNVKWLREIELVNYDYNGYWQERGWTEDATVNVLSIVDSPSGSVARDAAGQVAVGGVAFAGSRGIGQVQLRVDADDWLDAELEPYLPALIWQRWRYAWRPQPGKHTLTVRAVDLTGVAQIEEQSDPHPDGMTGLQTVTVRVE